MSRPLLDNIHLYRLVLQTEYCRGDCGGRFQSRYHEKKTPAGRRRNCVSRCSLLIFTLLQSNHSLQTVLLYVKIITFLG